MSAPPTPETFKPWAAVPGIPVVLFCEALHDDEAGVRIELTAADSRTRRFASPSIP